jgi:hypothetical protein
MRNYKLTYNLQKAATLISSGQKQRAMGVLAGILAEHPDNEQAWLWMASVVPHAEQRIYCLERVLKINPENQAVKERLAKLVQVRQPPASVSQRAHPSKELVLTDLRCKNCGAPIAEDHIVSHLAMAKCSYCGTVFSIQGLPVHKGRKAPEHFRRPEVAMPKGFKVKNVGNTWQISWRWFRWMHVGLAAWCVFWDGFLIVWYALSLGPRMWPMALCPTLHTIIGIATTYYTLAGFLNRTIVKIGNGRLEIWHYPLPWWGEKRLRTSDVEQFYCKKNVSSSSDGTTWSYEVYAMLHHGLREKLVTGLNEPEQALYIEQELERFLYIQDAPVPGEFARH